MRAKSRRRIACLVAFALGMAIGAEGAAVAAAAPGHFHLERLVMLMRHGVRSPTAGEPVPAALADKPWPQWDVAPGALTARGAEGAALLGRLDRRYLVRAGLWAAGSCPGAKAVAVAASSAGRAIATAEAWTKTALPGCQISVARPASDAADTLFHPLAQGEGAFDGHRAWLEANGMLPSGGVAAERRAYAGQVKLLGRVLGCRRPYCDLDVPAAILLEKQHDRPNLTGVFQAGTVASQTLLLEYLEGLPMAQVGWGRAGPPEIERLLAFHSIEFRYSNRVPSVARAAGGPVASYVVAALADGRDAPRVTMLVGHDTNIADIAGLLDLHWRVPGYPSDDAPPLGALGFELWSDGRDGRFVRAFYRSLSMKQLRALRDVAPVRRYLDIPGCGRGTDPRSCTLMAFQKWVAARLGDRPDAISTAVGQGSGQ